MKINEIKSTSVVYAVFKMDSMSFAWITDISLVII